MKALRVFLRRLNISIQRYKHFRWAMYVLLPAVAAPMVIFVLNFYFTASNPLEVTASFVLAAFAGLIAFIAIFTPTFFWGPASYAAQGVSATLCFIGGVLVPALYIKQPEIGIYLLGAYLALSGIAVLILISEKRMNIKEVNESSYKSKSLQH